MQMFKLIPVTRIKCQVDFWGGLIDFHLFMTHHLAWAMSIQDNYIKREARKENAKNAQRYSMVGPL